MEASPWVKQLWRWCDGDAFVVTHGIQTYGGMRGIKGLICETSALDPEEVPSIGCVHAKHHRAFASVDCPFLSVKRCFPHTRKAVSPSQKVILGYCFHPVYDISGLLWLLLTGEVPTKAQVDGLTEELRRREDVPEHVIKLLGQIPKSTHPMTQLVIGLMALQPSSKFSSAYHAVCTFNIC